MKIKYTLVYEIDIPDDHEDIKNYGLNEMGYMKAMNLSFLAKRYEKNDPEIISNTFELSVKGDALKIPN